MEGLTDLTLAEGEVIHLRVECTNCHLAPEGTMTLDPTEEIALNGSRGSAHLVFRCKDCRHENSATLVGGINRYLDAQAGSWAPMIELDCRGLEPVGFKPIGTWIAKGADSGTSFTEIDLEEGEWMDYDEKTGEAVSALEFQSKVERC
ncbi:hypothetical protein BJ684DRAFT_16107 [Piptocephalis cylindrospora]|uniref:DUF866-domain-containing protein n=1 Tax=Piptocephalis cylindrospora TaxID=1907219 RepID=A0A4P9Y3J9_9FUNG|nr:hypothetical protein BJ684DRAFT_16107 [Piptocephalis cylindrospora]|eukprot:RKP13496.1 hypothetical protein BJ684DRAFT_16107 [Piptocephalis cylindrospora]